MTKAKLLFHTAKKFTIHINRRTRAFITHQGRTPEETGIEEVMRH